MNDGIDLTKKKDETVWWTRNIVLSLLLHMIIFVLLILINDFTYEKSKINPVSLFLEIDRYQTDRKVITGPTEEIEKNPLPGRKPEIQARETLTEFIAFSDIQSDTTDLDQIYYESSLDLLIKYPSGWVFLDQKRKNKLDGVTFWDINTNIDPPPYIHLEVVEKYLFNEKRFHYSLKLKDCMAYYNEPEMMSGQVSQSFYLRTDDDEDYNIKLVIDGMDAFRAFQPKFLAILKSFSFGTDFF